MDNLSSLLSPTRARSSSSSSPRPTISSPIPSSAIPTATSDSSRRNNEYPEQQYDRFIPIRSASNLQEAFERGSLGGAFADGMGNNQNLMSNNNSQGNNQSLMNNLLRASLLGESSSGMKTTDAALSTGFLLLISLLLFCRTTHSFSIPYFCCMSIFPLDASHQLSHIHHHQKQRQQHPSLFQRQPPPHPPNTRQHFC